MRRTDVRRFKIGNMMDFGTMKGMDIPHSNGNKINNSVVLHTIAQIFVLSNQTYELQRGSQKVETETSTRLSCTTNSSRDVHRFIRFHRSNGLWEKVTENPKDPIFANTSSRGPIGSI